MKHYIPVSFQSRPNKYNIPVFLPEKYIILVTGAFSSGKTEFIKAISETEVVAAETLRLEVDENTYPPAYDFGRLTIYDSLALYFLGTPGTRRIRLDERYINEQLCLGIVMMVDSKTPETFREARLILSYLFTNSSVPIVVAANKQDRDGAWAADDIRIALRFPYANDIPIVPCVAHDRQSVVNVLLTLLNEYERHDANTP